MMSHKRRSLIKLYDKNKGLVTVSHDVVFKKLMTDSPSLLRLLLQQTLSLQGEIIDIKIENPELVSIERKSFILDLLLTVTVQAKDGQPPCHHSVNIEMVNSTDKDTVSKCVAYGSRAHSLQIPKGTKVGYHMMPPVHCLVIIKNKAPEFKDTKLYHHHHTYHNTSDPNSQTILPGVQYSFLELGKFEEPFEELRTTLEKICYFLKKTDKINMPLEEVVAYSNEGGPMGKALEQAMNNVIDYSVDGWPHDWKKQLDYLEQYLKENGNELIEERVKEGIEAHKEEAIRHGKMLGRIEGRAAGLAEGRAEGGAEGRVEGRIEGRAEGRAEGKAEGKAEGRIEGRAEGKEIAQKDLAQKLLTRGFDHDEIAQLTGLSIDAVTTISSTHGSDNS